ncbi:hypothetical protein PIB30_010166 [Stylosanthes scabra]|uniref:Ubiquitin-like protease family profile domain-containing protein n=1 Tax=Stylosanthes scabra TaxID=79078 RepID=A0ABU6Q5C5_9FABA|nr:hypothetical protein [Stylosanthes scabra]
MLMSNKQYNSNSSNLQYNHHSNHHCNPNRLTTKRLLISPSSEDANQPSPMKVLIPKTEEVYLPTNKDQPPNVVCQPSQSIVEVVPVYPSQKVIDISSSSEDEQPPLIPKKEQADDNDVSSPSSRIITDVLMSMNQDRTQEDIPSFDLGVGEPLLTTQIIEDITEMDDQLRNNLALLKTPKPTKSASYIQGDMESRVASWATTAKGENEFVTIFKLRGQKFLAAMRYQFMSMVPKTYINIQILSLMCHVLNKQAGERFQKLIYCVSPEILLVAPVLYADHWWLYVLDVDQRNIFVIDSKNIKSPTPE